MILADKIIKQRKRNGMSQEELAEKINVSRQSVSKWESAQSIPDIDKIIQLSNIFGVTTDYLLRDDMDTEEFADNDVPPVRKISLEEANAYVNHARRTSVITAISTFLCVVCPIPLIILTGLSAYTSLDEKVAVIVGIISIFCFVSAAIAGFYYTNYLNGRFSYMDDAFDREYGVEGAIREKKNASALIFTKLNIIATLLCVLSAVPLVVCAIFEKELLTVIMVGVLLLVVAIAAGIFIISGMRKSAYDKLLSEGEFSEKNKEENKILEVAESVYWTVATAVFLLWSFISGDWGITWIVWPIAGVLFAAVETIIRLVNKK